MYKIQNNIEIVSGAKYHCIYNLNTKKLYNLDTEHLNYLENLISVTDESVPETVKDYFLSEGIIVDTKDAMIDKIEPFQYKG